MADSPEAPAIARISGALSTLLSLASPFVLYVAVTRGRIEDGALVLFSYALLRAFPAMLAAQKEQRRAALKLPLVAVVSAAVGLVTREPRALLALPPASQAAFAFVFLTSLRSTPLVEQFARMKSPVLGYRQIAYCRTVTKVWGAILLAAAAVGGVLAMTAPLQVWAAFSTVGSYALIVVVFSTEYVVRRILFREYTGMPVDRILRLVFPPQGPPVHELHIPAAAAGAPTDVPIPRDLVFFRGHFDGTPLLPGVVQITHLIAPVARRIDPTLGSVRGLRRVRFRRPILPGDTVTVVLTHDARDSGDAREQAYAFELKIGESPVSSGTIVFAVKVPTEA